MPDISDFDSSRNRLVWDCRNFRYTTSKSDHSFVDCNVSSGLLKSLVLGKAKVISYKDLEEAQAKRVVKEAA